MRAVKTKKIISVFVSLALFLSACLNTSGFISKAEANEKSISFREVEGHFGEEDIKSGKINQNQTETSFDEDEIVRISIVLADESALEKGLLEEYGADSEEVNVYRENLKIKQNEVKKQITEELLGGEEPDTKGNLTLIGNVLSVEVPYGILSDIKSIPGVKDAFPEEKYEVDETEEGDEVNTYFTQEMINALYAWGEGYTGAGTIVAVIDTGINDSHIIFNNEAFLYSLRKNAENAGMVYEDYIESLNILTIERLRELYPLLHASDLFAESAPADNIYLNEKIPVSLNYASHTYDGSHKTPETNDHGSHVAGIVAGNKYIYRGGEYLKALDTVQVQGVAPDAQILNMKVFGESGTAHISDYFAAVEDAVVLGAAAANLSLGSTCGFTVAESSYYEDILDNLTETGLIMVCSAGNDRSWTKFSELNDLYADDNNYSTAGSPSTYTNTLSIASVDNIGSISRYFELFKENIPYFEPYIEGRQYTSFKKLSGEYDFVYIDGTGSAEEYAKVNGTHSLEGKIVLVNNGNIDIPTKINNLAEYNPTAFICVNSKSGILEMTLPGCDATFPCISVPKTTRDLIIDKAEKVYDGQGETLCYTGKISTKDGHILGRTAKDYYSMSEFSSWGIPGDLSLKPEITAPGGKIYSAYGSTDTEAVSYSGTSMSAPIISGAIAVLNQYIKENNLTAKTGLRMRQLVTSLLMSTAAPIIDENSMYYYPVLQQGAGLLDIKAAINSRSFIFMSDDATDSWADGKIKAELGEDALRTGTYSFFYNLNNMSDEKQTYMLYADFFTQSTYFSEELQSLMLSKYCTPIATSIVWTVDGRVIETGNTDKLKGADLNGDGCVDSLDAERLLLYTADETVLLYNKEAADIDGDKDIDTYDAYLFFKYLSEGVIELDPEASVQIEVTFTLEDIENYDYNGAYIEGYVYTDEIDADTDNPGVTHSIPVIGYYGSFTESSLYDGISYLKERVNAVNGVVSRKNYLKNSVSIENYSVQSINAFNYKKTDSEDEWLLGETEHSFDTVYYENRNAISANIVEKISGVTYAPLKNSAATRIRIYDEEGNLYYQVFDNEQTKGAFYSRGKEKWMNTTVQKLMDFSLYEIPEGTQLTFELACVPEYYINPDFDPETSDEAGFILWDKLGEGAFFRQTFTVDNTAPVLLTASLEEPSGENNGCVRLKVKDNYYISAVLLYYDGELIGSQGADMSPDIAPGNTCEYSFELTACNPNLLYIEVYDYANNVCTYELNLLEAEPVNTAKNAVTESAVTLSGNKETAFVNDGDLRNVLYENKENVHTEALNNPTVSYENVPEITNSDDTSLAKAAKSDYRTENNTIEEVKKSILYKKVEIYAAGDESDIITNGKITLSYDSSDMEFYCIDRYFGGYIATSNSGDSFTVSYVIPGGISAGEKLFTVYFRQKGLGHLVTGITENEVNNSHINKTVTNCISTHTYTKLINKKEATCLENGYTGDLVCKYCDEKLMSGFTVKAHGHTYVFNKCIYCNEVQPEEYETLLKKIIKLFSRLKAFN